jgi:hypothetical protein
VPGVDEGDLNAFGDGDRPVVADGLKQRQRPECVRLCIEGRAGAFGSHAGSRPQHLLPDPGGVRQHDAAQILGPGCRRCGPETLRSKPRQIAAMIQMGVRQNNRRNVRGLDGQILPVRRSAQALSPPSTSIFAAPVSSRYLTRSRFARRQETSDCESPARPLCQKSTVSRSLNFPTYVADQARQRLRRVGLIDKERFGAGNNVIASRDSR